MSDTLTLLAPAKLNLFLHITGKNVQGYHLLQTVFLLLDYGDTLTITLRDDGQIQHLNPLPNVSAEQDLCIRAAQALKQAFNCPLGADIQLQKRIPMGGGLGGGSSDAASVLMGLNQLWQLNASRAQLMQIGLRLGADVPIFIYGQPAWAEGVGELFTPIDLNAEYFKQYYVVLTPHIHVPTAQIFAHQALTRDTKPLRIADFSNTALSSLFKNDMEAVVSECFAEVKTTLSWLKQYGDARMSGSGGSVFVAVETQAQAEKIIANRPDNTSGFWAKGLKYHPHFSLVKSE